MMSTMKLGGVLLMSLMSAAFAGGRAELDEVQCVYLLPMGSGLDQYLASQLTTQDVFQVVTDAEQADAVFTDQIGVAFEKHLEELYPPPAPLEEVKTEEGEAAEATTPVEEEEQEPAVRFSSFSRGKGNVFLVGRKSRRVIWSIHERPKNTSAKELNRTAERMISQLKKALGGK